MNQPIFNQWAPPLLNGFNATSPDGCEDVDAGYVWPQSNGFQTLAPGEQREVTIILEGGDDFLFKSFIWALKPSEEFPNLGFLYRIQDDAGKFISDGFVYCYATPGTLANPWPMFPHITYAAHQRIVFEIINLDPANSQGFQIMFRGCKRFRRVG
jgi:hypothetical protein